MMNEEFCILRLSVQEKFRFIADLHTISNREEHAFLSVSVSEHFTTTLHMCMYMFYTQWSTFACGQTQ